VTEETPARIGDAFRSVPDEPVVVAVVPLYLPPEDARLGIAALAAQVARVVLIDDGSPVDVGEFVDRLALPNVRLIRSPENAGIAHALNVGIRAALDDVRADFVITTDQDSVLADDYVERAIEAIRLLRRRGVHFTAVAAGTVDDKLTRGKELGYLPYRSTRETIQSGMVFPVEVLSTLGGFDESFFIDCVDTDYILRGATTGRPTILVAECRMQHSMGAGIPVRLPFFFRDRERRLPYHGPVRRYYITRNRARLTLRHCAHNPQWAVRQTYEQAKSATADLVYGPDRVNQVRATALGLLDGIRGRGGRIAPEVEAHLRGSTGEAPRDPDRN
jgi:rhamnosyltransferase